MNPVDKRNNMIDMMLYGQCHITFGSGIPSTHPSIFASWTKRFLIEEVFDY
jgi:hypothetical protein